MTSALVSHVLDQVMRHAGLVFQDVRLLGATEAIAAWLERHQIRDPSRITPLQLEGLLEELVVHESYFDRDLEQLALVDELVLSRFARSTGPVRVWSAGCARGEEPYTLAFMLARRDLLSRASIIGTDLSRPALEKARAGRYRASSVRNGAETPALKYLERSGSELCVPERIKQVVRFAPLNLLEDSYPEDQHLVVCRNVLIYFDAPTIAIVAQKFAAALHPEGWLFVAPSDPRLDPHAPLTAYITDRGVYYRSALHDPPRVVPRTRPPTQPLLPLRLPPIAPTRTPLVAAPRVVTAKLPPSASAAPGPRELADRGDYAAARAALVHALVASPLDAELYFLSAVLDADDDVAAAIRDLERAMYLAPEAPLSYIFAGRLLQARGEQARARRAYRSALRILEQHPADVRVPWTDEPAPVLAAACRAGLAALGAAA